MSIFNVHNDVLNLDFPNESADQAALLESVLSEEKSLSPVNRQWTAWAAALATKDTTIVDLIKNYVGDLTGNDQRELTYAVSRMSVTNPYFMSRSTVSISAGGSLNALHFRSFAEIDVKNEIAYHYACVAVSMVNAGFACFQSHCGSLKQLGESDKAIDQALRITAALIAARQIAFNQKIFNSQ